MTIFCLNKKDENLIYKIFLTVPLLGPALEMNISRKANERRSAYRISIDEAIRF